MKLQDHIQNLMQTGDVIDWRRAENHLGARLKVMHRKDMSEERIREIRRGIAEVEGCEPDWVEMLPGVRLVRGA